MGHEKDDEEEGIRIYEFYDVYGNRCVLMESSHHLVGVSPDIPGTDQPGLAFGRHDAGDISPPGTMRLSVDLVRDLIPLLQRFADTGRL